MAELVDMMIDDNPSAKKEVGNAPSVAKMEEPEGPKYPYGLELSFDKDVLDKLGIEGCEVGDEYMIMAKAKVKSVSENEYEDSDYNKNVTMQITEMSVDHESQDEGVSIGQAEKEAMVVNAIEDRLKNSGMKGY